MAQQRYFRIDYTNDQTAYAKAHTAGDVLKALGAQGKAQAGELYETRERTPRYFRYAASNAVAFNTAKQNDGANVRTLGESTRRVELVTFPAPTVAQTPAPAHNIPAPGRKHGRTVYGVAR
jgi:hypothetical protein